jgi:hypothetical protein
MFSGVWNGYVPLECEYKLGTETVDIEEGVVCLIAGGELVVTPNVTYHMGWATIPDLAPDPSKNS